LVPGNLLRVIEEAANDDPVEMQNGFKAFDGCSGKSNKVLSLLLDENKSYFCAL
jgi:hypothetical protein